MTKSRTSKNSKLIDLILVFSLKEKRDLEKFLTLTSNNLTSRDREIFSQLLSKLTKEKGFNEEIFWSKYLSGDEYKNKNRIKSRLFKAVENYICLLEISKNDGMKTLLLSTFYLTKNLIYNLKSTLKKSINHLSPIRNSSPTYRIMLYWLYEKLVFISKDIRQESIHINQMEVELDEFYSSNKLRILCEKINRSKILNSGFDASIYNEEVERLRAHSSSAYTDIYYHLFQLLSSNQDSSFITLNQKIAEHPLSLDLERVKEVYVHLMNYCIRKINERELGYANQFITYSKFLDSNDILLDQNMMSIGRFKNILVVCYIINDLDWAKYIIHKYSAHLQETMDIKRRDFLSLNKAIMALWQNDYEGCMDNVHSFQSSSMYHKDVYYKIACDKLLLKLYYEKAEYELLHNKVSVLIVYIRNRKKLNKKRQEPNLTFLYLLDKLSRNKPVQIEADKSKILLSDYIWLERVLKKG